jgi:ubiquinone/menaquinone biosynthesis C-methylase UbiE
VTSDGVIRLFDEAADTYENVGVEFFAPIGAGLVERAGIRAGEDVLDVGSGSGAVLVPAARAGANVVGIDLAPRMVARAATAAAAAGVDVTVAVGDAQAPDFPPGSFDVVTAGLVLFFLPDPIGALRAYRRLLRPGGRVAFTSFRSYDPRYPAALRALRGFAVDPPEPPRLAPMFDSPEGLSDAVVMAGFAEPRVESFAVYSRFAGSDQFFGWIGSHAGSAVVGRIPPENRAAAAGALAAIVDGPVEFTTSLWFSSGTKR